MQICVAKVSCVEISFVDRKSFSHLLPVDFLAILKMLSYSLQNNNLLHYTCLNFSSKSEIYVVVRQLGMFLQTLEQ